MFTSLSVSGLVISQPNNLIADPASRAEPNAVDLERSEDYGSFGHCSFEDLLSHLGSDNAETSDVGKNTHGQVTICHAAINIQMLEVSAGIKLHALDDRTRLERICLQRCTSNM